MDEHTSTQPVMYQRDVAIIYNILFHRFRGADVSHYFNIRHHRFTLIAHRKSQ